MLFAFRLIVAAGFGAFVSAIGFSYTTWEFWVLGALFIIYGILCVIDK
jgi:hypothetical protein